MSSLNASRADPPVSVVSGPPPPPQGVPGGVVGGTRPCTGDLPLCIPIHTKSETVVVVLVTDVILENLRNLIIFESKFLQKGNEIHADF